VRVKKLIPFINSVFNKIKNFRNDAEFNEKIWIFFSGDKGEIQ